MNSFDPGNFNFSFCPRCGSQAFRWAKAFHCQCNSCQLDYFINAAAAVGGFIQSPKKKLLWIRRAKNPGKGMLAVPGGFVDPGENATEALTREVQEEVGLHVAEWTFLSSAANRYEYKSIHYPTLDLFFVGTVDASWEAKPLDEVTSVEWKNLNEVDPGEIAFDSMRDAFFLYQTLKSLSA